MSFQEIKTSKKIVELLIGYGISEIYENVGKTGVVAVIRGAQDGPCVGLRADMDALSIVETAEVISFMSDFPLNNDSIHPIVIFHHFL